MYALEENKLERTNICFGKATFRIDKSHKKRRVIPSALRKFHVAASTKLACHERTEGIRNSWSSVLECEDTSKPLRIPELLRCVSSAITYDSTEVWMHAMST